MQGPQSKRRWRFEPGSSLDNDNTVISMYREGTCEGACVFKVDPDFVGTRRLDTQLEESDAIARQQWLEPLPSHFTEQILVAGVQQLRKMEGKGVSNSNIH
jgi:hypothetical protein